jgi:hypothetical protein
MYSVDFQPCGAIYCSSIRSQMPTAFSGYEMRERQFGFMPSLAAFHLAIHEAGSDELLDLLRAKWWKAEDRYHELHVRCMVQAVPARAGASDGGDQQAAGKPESLRAAYRRQHGSVPEIGDGAFCEYDQWFRIERRREKQSTAVTSAWRRSASKLNHPSHAPMSSTRLPCRSPGIGKRAKRSRKRASGFTPSIKVPSGSSKL